MNIQSNTAVSAEMRLLSEYIAGAAERALPPAVVEKPTPHLLDTLAAILSGSRLRAGKLAAGYAARVAGAAPSPGEATLVGTALLVPAEFAALANGMAGHADETDDSHLRGRFHPRCGIVPAALAIAGLKDRRGSTLPRPGAPRQHLGPRP